MSSPTRIRGPEAVDAAWREQPVGDDAIEQDAGFVVELARGGAVVRVIEDCGEASLQLPRREEEGPVDVRHEVVESHIVEQSDAGERRRGAPCRCSMSAVDDSPALPPTGASAAA